MAVGPTTAQQKGMLMLSSNPLFANAALRDMQRVLTPEELDPAALPTSPPTDNVYQQYVGRGGLVGAAFLCCPMPCDVMRLWCSVFP